MRVIQTNLIDRINRALSDDSVRIDHRDFEDCAVFLLSDFYQKVVPIPGGTDWGVDAEILQVTDNKPIGVIVTSSRTFVGVTQSLTQSLDSAIKHKVVINALVLVNLASLNKTQRVKLEGIASSKNFKIIQFFDRGFISNELLKNSGWRKKLINISGGPFSFSLQPLRMLQISQDVSIVGRSNDLDLLNALDSDVIVTGYPGVGKTRLLAELPDSYFAIGHPDTSKLQDDLLDLKPKRVVVDDALSYMKVVEDLIAIRVQEAELEYQLLVTCWPHEVEKIELLLKNAYLHRVQPLLREDQVKIIHSLGISNQKIIHYILSQSEGRAGWVISLSALIGSHEGWKEFARGAAISREIREFILHSRLPEALLDLLPVIALLGEISEQEFEKLATTTFGWSRLELRNLVHTLAISGLLDVYAKSGEAGYENVYSVRPERLAIGLVIEGFYSDRPQIQNVQQIYAMWKDKQESIVLSILKVALLEVPKAKPLARQLFMAMLHDRSILEISDEIILHYLHLGKTEASETVQLLFDAWFEQLKAGFPKYATAESEAKKLIPVLVQAFKDVETKQGITLALDIAFELETKDINGSKGFIEEITKELSKLDFEHGVNLVQMISSWNLACAWFENRERSRQKEYIILFFFTSIFKPYFEGSWQSPIDPRSINFGGQILNPSQIVLLRDIWEKFNSYGLVAKHPHEVIETLRSWENLAKGFLLPFSLKASQEEQDQAKEVFQEVLRSLVNHPSDSPALRFNLRQMTEGFNFNFDLAERDPFLRALFANGKPGRQWSEEESDIEKDVAIVVRPFLKKNPRELATKLKGVESELALRQNFQPNTVFAAMKFLSRNIANPGEWVKNFLDVNFLQYLDLLVNQLETDALTPELTSKLLDNRGTREPLIRKLFNNELHSTISDLVIMSLDNEDFEDFQMLFYRNEYDLVIVKKILNSSVPSELKAVIAAAIISYKFDDEDVVVPEEILQEWGQAITELVIPTKFRNYLEDRILINLARFDEPLFLELLITNFELQEIGEKWPHFDDWGQAIAILSDESKSSLWDWVKSKNYSTWFLRLIIQTDEAWAELALSEGLISAEQVFKSQNGFEPQLSIESISRLLVDRGVAPVEIIRKIQLGFYSGDEHERLEHHLELCRGMNSSEDVRLHKVGRAGIEHFTPLLKEAEKVARLKNIRGEL